jgi:hypothetical protein
MTRIGVFIERLNILPEIFPIFFLPRIISLKRGNSVDFAIADEIAKIAGSGI